MGKRTLSYPLAPPNLIHFPTLCYPWILLLVHFSDIGVHNGYVPWLIHFLSYSKHAHSSMYNISMNISSLVLFMTWICFFYFDKVQWLCLLVMREGLHLYMPLFGLHWVMPSLQWLLSSHHYHYLSLLHCSFYPPQFFLPSGLPNWHLFPQSPPSILPLIPYPTLHHSTSPH